MPEIIQQGRESRQKRYLEQWKETEEFKDSGEDRDLHYAESEINRLKGSLALDDKTTDQALRIYKTARDMGITQGRSIDNIIPASIYISVRQMGQGRSIKEISDHSIVSENQIGKTFRYLSKELGLSVDIATPDTYLDRFMTKVNSIRVSEDLEPLGDDVKEMADEILEISTDEGIDSGRSPTGFAAAAIYLAGKRCGYKKVRQSDLAEVAEVSELTIRQHYQAQEEVFDASKDS